MFYEDCLWMTLIDVESWLIVFAGVVFAAGFWHFGRPRSAGVICIGAMICAGGSGYLLHELNCVELSGG